MNASLASIRAGLRPVVQHEHNGKLYLRFRNGQIRLFPGQGHSIHERAQKREARNERRDVFMTRPLDGASTTTVLARLDEARRLAADKAALSSV